MKLLKKLHNIYFALRHGQSEANVQGLIVSHPKNGIFEYGLTEVGKDQVKKSVVSAKQNKLLDQSTIIISSPFKRAKETAEITREILGVKDIVLRNELQERNFGLLEKTTFDYHLIWEKDANEPSHTMHDVENTSDVQKRTIQLIEDLEKKYMNKNILLVSHGDILQILQTAFEAIHPSQHRSLKHLENGEIRRLN